MASATPTFKLFSLPVASFARVQMAMAGDPDVVSDFLVPLNVTKVGGTFFTFTGMHRYLLLSSSRKLVQLNSLLLSGKVFLVQCFNSRLVPLIHLTHPRSNEVLFLVLFKQDSLTQLTSSSPRHYRVVICSLQIQDRCSPALAFSAFESAWAGTVSLPTSLFAAASDDNILAKVFKTDVAIIQALKSGFAPIS